MVAISSTWSRCLASGLVVVCLATLARSQEVALPKAIVGFLNQIPREGRGPSRSLFDLPAAEKLSQSLVDSSNPSLCKLLPPTTREEIRRQARFISSYQPQAKSTHTVLESIDKRDSPYEEVLVDAFQGDSAQQLAVELLRLEGLSALRRPAVASIISLDDQSRKKVSAAISQFWDNAGSMQGGLFFLSESEQNERKETYDGLKYWSESADKAALQILAPGQIKDLAALLSEYL